MRISDVSSDVYSADLDASNENAELFLQLAGALVARMETQAIRGRSLTLTAPAQQDVLLTKAREIMNGWAFPFARQVRELVDRLAADCGGVSLLPNARLGYGDRKSTRLNSSL